MLLLFTQFCDKPEEGIGVELGLAVGRHLSYTDFYCGAWRSPVARLHGVQEVMGSNPVAPTALGEDFILLSLFLTVSTPTISTFLQDEREVIIS